MGDSCHESWINIKISVVWGGRAFVDRVKLELVLGEEITQEGKGLGGQVAVSVVKEI